MAGLEKLMPIGALALRSGVKVETIRYYEQVGLMPPPERTEGNQRRYGGRHRERLSFIRHARDLGFSVEGIRTLLRLSDTPEMPCDEAHAISCAHLDDVRRKIRQLRTLEKELQRIASVCSGGHHAGDCALIDALADHRQCHAEHGREPFPSVAG